jgi:hypothetical protein
MIKLLHAALEEDDEFGTVLRGVLDPESFKFVGLDWYQREQGFSQKHISTIVQGLFSKSIMEDLLLGMRGSRVQSNGEGGYTLGDKVFCMNGGQRLYAAQWAMKERPDFKPHLGVKVVLNTNEKMENEIFCKAGTTQVRIAASVLIRNRKKESRVASLLVRINDKEDFALRRRIGWGQKKSTHELMTGLTFCKVVGALHAHKSAGLLHNQPYELLAGLDNLLDVVGAEILESNIVRFFDVIDSCWSIRNIVSVRTDPSPHLKQFFLKTVAKLFSRYSDFWDGKERIEFFAPARFVKSLRSFPLAKFIHRADVVDADILYENLRKHLKLQPIIVDDDVAGAA